MTLREKCICYAPFVGQLPKVRCAEAACCSRLERKANSAVESRSRWRAHKTDPRTHASHTMRTLVYRPDTFQCIWKTSC